MTSSKPYDPADLNMARLQAYARRVARDTRAPHNAPIHGKRASDARGAGVDVELFGAHWSLLQLTSNGETFDHPRKLAEWHLRKHWILAPDGQLFFVSYEENFAQYGSGPGSWTFSSTAEPMTTHAVLEMDYDHPRRSGENKQNKETWWGDTAPGRLKAHAPGVGVSLALKRLLPA